MPASAGLVHRSRLGKDKPYSGRAAVFLARRPGRAPKQCESPFLQTGPADDQEGTFP